MADFDENNSFSPNLLGDFKDESEKKLYESLKKNPKLDYDPDEDEMTEEQYLAMIERKKRIEERRAAGRAKRAQEAEKKRLDAARKAGLADMKKAAAKKAEPVTKKAQPAGQKTEAPDEEPKTGMRKKKAETTPVVRTAPAEGEGIFGENGGKQGRRISLKERREKQGRKVFYISLACYAFVLLVLGFIFLRYTDHCLRKYEKSRPENAVNGLVKEFALKVKDGSVLDYVELPKHACVFESEDLYRTTYLKQLQEGSTFVAEKDKNSYDSAHPVYDIISNGNLVAKMSLTAENEKTIFAILRIGTWKIDKIIPVLTVSTNSYRIAVPDTYKVTVNDITVSDEFRKGEPVPVKVTLPDAVMPYVTVPSTVTYVVEGLAEKPEIKIFNSMGGEVPYEADANGNIRIEASIGVPLDTMSQERHDFALETAQMWTDFLTRDLGGSKYGLNTIRKRLLVDSSYYIQAGEYASDVDITFISDHHDGNPKYTNVSVTEYTEYSDTCYSCRIRFTKNMILNKTGQLRTVEIDTTNFYVFADDSDDQIINPHWCVVDMKTTTKEQTFGDEE